MNRFGGGAKDCLEILGYEAEDYFMEGCKAELVKGCGE